MKSRILGCGAALLLIGLAAPLHGQESEDEEEERLNAVELFLGGVTETSESATGFGAGLGYVRRLSSLWGLGVAGELSTTDVERAWLLNVPIYFYPAGGLGIKVGPVIEGSKEKPEEGEESETETELGVRFGAAWEFEVGERFTVSPEVNLDLVDGSTTWVYGLTFGLGF
jgi:hypothetical protein